jgi:glyoxylase-like metal-dependent hydrolase (beta-lactamase superfamily II)
MTFWTGRYAHKSRYAPLVNTDDLSYLVRANLSGRICFVDGDATIADGLSVHWVGGHTAGQQVIRVNTAAGHAVLASDAIHFYKEIDEDEPYNIVHYVPDMYESFARVSSLADDPQLIVAGHDPQVRSRYRVLPGELSELVSVIGTGRDVGPWPQMASPPMEVE